MLTMSDTFGDLPLGLISWWQRIQKAEPAMTSITNKTATTTTQRWGRLASAGGLGSIWAMASEQGEYVGEAHAGRGHQAGGQDKDQGADREWQQ